MLSSASSCDRNEIQQLLTCKICNEQYEYPVFLPCFNTVCSKHVFNETSDSNFECFLCKKHHKILSDEFLADEKINKLIEISQKYINIDSINFGSRNKKAREFCSNLESILSKAEVIINDPYFYIEEYFAKLKNEIDLAKEKQIQMIEDNHDRLLKEIKEMENEASKKVEKKHQVFDQIIAKSKFNLDYWNETLMTPDFNLDSEWKEIEFEAEREMEKLSYLMEKYQSDLLLNKSYEFHPNPENFGNIEVKNKEILDENRLEGTIRMIIDDFSTFRKKIDEYYWSKDYCIINNISWTMNAEIQETDTNDLCLGFYVSPITLGDIPVNTKITFKIIPHEVKQTISTLQGTVEHKFSKNLGFGFHEFILLKEILDPENGIYDYTNDSITIEANIKVLSE